MLKRYLQGIEDSSVRLITNGVYTLNERRARVNAREDERAVGGRTTCHPSSRYLGITSFRVSGSILMKP